MSSIHRPLKMDRSKAAVRELGESADDYCPLTPKERFLCVWPLTLEVWFLADPEVAERPMQRNIGTVIRGRR